MKTKQVKISVSMDTVKVTCPSCGSDINPHLGIDINLDSKKATKDVRFRCDPFNPKAMKALQIHMDANPNGLPLFNSRSSNKIYFGYRIYETKTCIVVEELK